MDAKFEFAWGALSLRFPIIGGRGKIALQIHNKWLFIIKYVTFVKKIQKKLRRLCMSTQYSKFEKIDKKQNNILFSMFSKRPREVDPLLKPFFRKTGGHPNQFHISRFPIIDYRSYLQIGQCHQSARMGDDGQGGGGRR